MPPITELLRTAWSGAFGAAMPPITELLRMHAVAPRVLSSRRSPRRSARIGLALSCSGAADRPGSVGLAPCMLSRH
ncbi:MAG: hypothetical protein JO020_21870 [Chloroflexi bacterium]|nr:hypothetical protein [Chloroflexota bacterium]MBV9896819.1 hypothetical protein [Chloroflexota bacterium]